MSVYLVIALMMVLALAAVGWVWSHAPTEVHARPIQVAVAAREYTWRMLAAPYPDLRCEQAQHIAYAREQGATITDHWYVSSQVLADITLANLNESPDPNLDCTIDRSVAYLEKLWNPVWPGGYYPRSDLDGANPTTRDIYADDNAIAGLAMLETAQWTSDPALRARALLGAQRAADYLIDSGLWDDQFGGGFWWNTLRGQSEGGKPVQTVGLAVQLFARLAQETGDARYREWAERGLTWADERLYDAESGMYRYGLNVERRGQQRAPTFVSYDQAIMIEAHLAVVRSMAGDATHLVRAQQLASSIEEFRSPLGGYVFELGVPQVFSSYSAWTAMGLLELYQVDHDTRWKVAAEGALADLNRVLVDPVDGGVYYGSYACVNDWVAVCPMGAESAIDWRKLHLSQSWTQRAFALLASINRNVIATDRGGDRFAF